ncbi:hypothetical protein NDU88_001447 [Pleurodeles waltl]|uniref:Uncharacterized protein n=1 Tax=Pleurodeles waltl TaxID=8319 RepID=A0AAV7R758_PLEWA|nr:hypothetical protein NDU88_001447 [Pleurodeles waltl]
MQQDRMEEGSVMTQREKRTQENSKEERNAKTPKREQRTRESSEERRDKTQQQNNWGRTETPKGIQK